MSEINWGWPEIACVLMWRLAPRGLIITRRDLGRLPMDRVLLEDRRETEIKFSWIDIHDAQSITKPTAVQKASVSELQGRWQKIAVVLLWKLARQGVTLTQADRNAVPADQMLLAEGHADDIEYRFCPRKEAQMIAANEANNEGKIILEKAAV